jgi:hypothetical protein
MRRFTPLLVGLVAAAGLVAAPVAQAMGTGNPYVDQQVGVSYTVYQPKFTAGLGIQHGGGDATCPAGQDIDLMVQYGKTTGRAFTIWEGSKMCRDIGNGPTVMTTKINGAEAVLEAYCDPASSSKCTKADVSKYGGNLKVTFPGKAPYGPTVLWIETFSQNPLSAQQLVKIAKSLAPVS